MQTISNEKAATAALAKLKSDGVKLEVVNLKLKVSGSLTDEHRELIREHKRWLTGMVHAEQCFALERAEKLEENLEDAGHAKIYSKIFDEVIYLAADQATAEKLRKKTQMAVYEMAEVGEMLAEPAVSQDGLRRLHRAKKLFGGKIVNGEVRPLNVAKKRPS